MTLSDSHTHALRRRRGRAAIMGLLGVLGVLLLAFFRLQVLDRSTYVLRSQENRLRAISVPAPRGTIYDRNGRIVAESVPGYTISLLPGQRDTVGATIDRLAPYLDLDDEIRDRLLQTYSGRPNEPLVLRRDATFEQVSVIQERRPEFRRVVVEMRPRRHYPAGDAIAHLIGYVGEISETELEQERYAAYEAGRTIGKDGLEKQYEERLAGQPGVRYVEVNALGSIVQEFGARERIDAIPGDDLTLGIDLELQLLADSIFPEGRRGAVVALDPRTGEILLLYSHPTFDPNRFIGGIDSELWAALRDHPDMPLLNRVTTATYAPGSTWKLFVATVGMQTSKLDIDTYVQQTCGGSLRFGNRVFGCWKPGGHGRLDLTGAIRESCNVYFYQAGQRIGLEDMARGATELGYNTPTGIDLPFEARGLFPSGAEWFDRRYGQRGWTAAVELNLSIGQGENQQTILRQAHFYTALATGGTPIQPHLAREEVLEGRMAPWSLDLPEARRLELVEALRQVVNEPGGTAYPYRLGRWAAAGKTGTAQNPHGEPHSWFVGFAPQGDPRIVIAAIVEFGHPDNTVSLAVPLATRLLDRYLESAGVRPEPVPGAVAGSVP